MSEFRSDLKIIELRYSNEGKTVFVKKWRKDIFSDTYKATTVSEFGFKIYEKWKNISYSIMGFSPR